MARAVHHIEGIGPHYAGLLKAAGITTIEHLLQEGATRRGRIGLSRRTGISSKLLHKWVNLGDLFRVRGVAGQYVELLDAVGVDTVRALCTREADSLVADLGDVNSKRHLVRTLPNSKRVSGWIEHARTLQALVSD